MPPHSARPDDAPDDGRAPRTRTRGHLTFHAFHGADETAPVAPVAAPRESWQLPNGQLVTPEERGVYWHRHRRGPYHVAYAVDSTGDSRGHERRVLATAPRDEFNRAINELWDLLDIVDPLPGPERP